MNPVVLSGYFPVPHNSPCLFSRQWEGRCVVIVLGFGVKPGFLGHRDGGEAAEATHAFVSAVSRDFPPVLQLGKPALMC